MGAYSSRQYEQSGFNGKDYVFNEQVGLFTGILRCKKYGKKTNIIAYVDFDDGRKIMCTAYQRKDYLGLKEIEIGSRLKMAFDKNTKGNIQLDSITVI